MKTNIITLTIVLASSLILLSGCASKKDTFGSRLSEQGEQASDIAQRYEKAEKLIKAGEAKVKKGKKLSNRGETLQSNGERQISQGQDIKSAAIAEYCQQDNYRDPNCN